MTTSMVCDDNGYAITEGLSEHEARAVAQSIANRRGKSVWLVTDDNDEEIEPDNTDESAP